MAVSRPDVFFMCLMVIFIFYIKKPSFNTPDGVSIALREKDLYDNNTDTFIYSSLWITKQERNYKHSTKNLIHLLLLICGDIEQCPGPLQAYVNVQNFLRTKGFSILHQNIRGLTGKKDLLADILYNNKINILALSETFLSHETFTDVQIGGYSFEYKNRKSAGGGIGAYIKDGTPYTRREDLECEELEMFWLELSFKNAKKFLLAVIYRPPDSSKYLSKDFVKAITEKIQTVQKENKETIIVGDINCDYSNPEDHCDIKTLFNVNGFKQIVKKSTRITKSTSTLIDVVLTNAPETIIHTDVITTNLSDHEMIGAIRKKCQQKYQPRTVRSRTYKNYKAETVRNEIKNLKWEALFNCNNPTNAWYLLKDALVNVANRHAPFTMKTIKGKPCPWLNENIKREMNYRDALNRKAQKKKTETNWLAYKRQKNLVNNLIKKAKMKHHTELLEDNATKPEQFWKCIKNLFPTKATSDTTCTKFQVNNGEIISDKQQIANGFCNFFQKTAMKLKQSSIKLRDFIWSAPNLTQTNRNAIFKFTHVSVPEVKKHLKELKRKKSEGIDEIPNCILKDCAHELAPQIAHIINLSLKSAQIPSDLKTAKITPIYKDGEKSQYTNYRPISVLPTISKILERCVYNQLIEHLESHDLISPQQFGFRKKRSTEMATVLFLDDIQKAMDSGKLTGAMFIDLSKAFDTVSHSSILDKLPKYGIVGLEKLWFTDYLFGRSMKVNYKGASSDTKSISCGVPQGSILGPLLFLLHFNELPSLLKKCKMIMYADDTVLYYHHQDTKEIEKAISNDISIVSTWLQDNELILNLKKGKTEFMVFGTRNRLNRQHHDIDVKYQSQSINTTKTYKYLGVQLDPSLNMDQHFNNVCKKVSTRIRLLKRIRPFITDLATLRIYQALIIPAVTYCSLTNFFHQASRKAALSAFELRVRKLTNRTIPSINSINDRKICLTVFKCINNQQPMFENYFDVISHEKNTRNNNNLLRVPKIKLQGTKRAFFYNGVFIYNKLPTNVRAESDRKLFYKKLENVFNV